MLILVICVKVTQKKKFYIIFVAKFEFELTSGSCDCN